MKKAVPIGVEDFKNIIDNQLYYVDKTFMIKNIIDSGAAATLFTRPRRFGKTLNLSMIRRFFEDERKQDGTTVDNRYLFDGLEIASAGEKYTACQQNYPVISLSLKSAKQPSYELAYLMLKKEIASEYKRHEYILNSTVFSDEEKKIYRNIMIQQNDERLYLDAIKLLSQYLMTFHGNPVVILVDEYDVPLENAYFNGFYDEMTVFIRSLFESALKTNPNMAFAIITGCLRISKESIFTGLNNLRTESLLDARYAEGFGFTQSEIKALLDEYHLEGKQSEVQSWYDGYRIGNAEIYNPWSILNYIDTASVNAEAFPKPYWANTSSNDIIKELIENANQTTRSEMERLLNGETIEKPVHEDITYGDIHESEDNLWNFLFFTGYLRKCGEHMQGNRIYLTLCIPNREIASIYEDIILKWFDKTVKNSDFQALYDAVKNGDEKTFEEIVSDQLQKTISFFDYKEEYYHGFLAGILSGMPGYEILSNRESGTGRPDLILKEQKFRGKAIIMELKIADRFSKMEFGCKLALEQIEKQNYTAALEAEGCSEILKYGICFIKKGCMVLKAE